MNKKHSETSEEEDMNIKEVLQIINDWGSSTLDENKRSSLFHTTKIYFYSPYIFGRNYLEKYWNDAIADKLITSSDLKPSLAKKFIIQLTRLEKTFSTVCDAFQEVQLQGRFTKDVTTLLHITNHYDGESSVDEVLLLASDVPFFEYMRKKLDKCEYSPLILLHCLLHFLHILELVVVQEEDPEKVLRNIPKGKVKNVDRLKSKGNTMFQSNKYSKAVTYYTSAIVIDCYNPVLYCNRAQANLYLDDNWEALLDAKRAILLDPTWPKAYYRFSQALYELDYLNKAIEENQLGQRLCRENDKDIKDLQSQLSRFLSEKERVEYMEEQCGILPACLQALHYVSEDSSSDSEHETAPDYSNLIPDHYIEIKDERGNLMRVDTVSNITGISVDQLRMLGEKKKKRDEKYVKEYKIQREVRRKKDVLLERNRKEAELRREEEKLKEKARKDKDKVEKKKALVKERNAMLEQASNAYLEGRARQSYEGYQKADEIMSQSTGKFGGLTEGDRVIFLYAYGMAALETGNPHVYALAMEKFNRILTEHKTIRTALPYYGKALTYFKMNQFKEAYDPIEKGMFISETFETSLETWPGTGVNIEQTKTGCMTDTLSCLKDSCLNPPNPGAYCRYGGCDTRQEIYFNDILFKGYVKVLCSEQCKVDYHIHCWRKLRDEKHRKTDKDVLDAACFTPDCLGLILDVSVFGEDGLIMFNETKSHHEKTKIKTLGSKQGKKEKKASKKVKHKERGQGDLTHQEQEMSDANSTVSVSLPPFEDMELVISESVVSSPDVDSVTITDTYFKDLTDASSMLHQEPSYILKKEEPEVEEKKPAPKTSKSKNKKKKKEALTLQFGFADRDDRHLLTDADVPDYSLVRNGHQDAWYHPEPHQHPVVIVTEEDQNQMLVLHLHFREIFENNGPLKVSDSILRDEVSRLTLDHQELINRHGGLALFLVAAPDMFAMLDNYVCRVEDFSKCRDIVEHQKVVWTPLPIANNAGGPLREPSLGRTSRGNQSHHSRINNVEQSHKAYQMNCLDTFNEGGVSSGTDALNDGVGEVEITEALDGELQEQMEAERELCDEDDGHRVASDGSDTDMASVGRVTTAVQEVEITEALDGELQEQMEAERELCDEDDGHHVASDGSDTPAVQDMADGRVTPAVQEVEITEALDGELQEQMEAERELCDEDDGHRVASDGSVTSAGLDVASDSSDTSSVQDMASDGSDTPSVQDVAKDDSVTHSVQGVAKNDVITPSAQGAANDQLIPSVHGVTNNDDLEPDVQPVANNYILPPNAQGVVNDKTCTPSGLDATNNDTLTPSSAEGMASDDKYNPSGMDATNNDIFTPSAEASDDKYTPSGMDATNNAILTPSAEGVANDDKTCTPSGLDATNNEMLTPSSRGVANDDKYTTPSGLDTTNNDIFTHSAEGVPNENVLTSDLQVCSVGNGDSFETDGKDLVKETKFEMIDDRKDTVNDEITAIDYGDTVVSSDSCISLDKGSQKDKEDEIEDINPRCNSYETTSSESVSSGISSSSSGFSVDKTINVVTSDKLIPWKKSVRDILDLFPEIKEDRAEEDDESLLRLFSGQVYQLVERLKERADEANRKSVGTSTPMLSYSSKGVNTDVVRTYEYEYNQAMKKCKSVEMYLQDAITKYKSLENMMISHQSSARSDQLQQKGIIENLERNLRQKEEKSQRDVSSAQNEKSRLLSLVHEHEAQARDTQIRLDEYKQVKTEADQLKVEKDTWSREKRDMEKKMDEIKQQCQRQRQRATKSEISVVQIHKDQALRPIDEAVTECTYHINNLGRILKGEVNANLTVILKDWERCLEENKLKLETTKNHFDSQMKQLHSGRLVLTDLPVIPRPEPSRSKTLKPKHPAAPPHWPPFGTRPPLPGSTINGAPSHFPPPQVRPHPSPQKPLDSSSSIPPSSTPSNTVIGLPPARGMVNVVPQGPGSTMPLAPGPGSALPAGLRHLPIPIGTRSNGNAPPPHLLPAQPLVQGATLQGATRERDSTNPTEYTGTIVNNAPLLPTPVMNTARYPPYKQGTMSERRASATPRSSYTRIMERLEKRFLNYNKVQLTNFLRVVRVNNGNSLSGLSMEGIMDKVVDLISEAESSMPTQKIFLDGNNRETYQMSQTPAAPRGMSVISAPPSKNPWSSVDDAAASWQNEVYNDEVDPCVICHEEMALKEVLDLECGHRFHADCIEEWLGTKSTCPNCRTFTKLKQDFPPLTMYAAE